MGEEALTNSDLRRYDVALSFAGENREYVESVAAALSRGGISVFYDRYEEASLWGKNLYDHLQHVYSESAEFTVIFVSAAYAKKLWTTREREIAQSRAFTEKREYILPARFDDTPVPGLLPTTGYVDLRQKNPEELATLIAQKLRQHGLIRSEATERDSLRKVPLFGAALKELENHGTVSVAIMEALYLEDDPPPGLELFLLTLARGSQGWARTALVGYAIHFVNKFDVGRQAVRYYLEEAESDPNKREQLGMRMQYVTQPDAIRWAHQPLTLDIHSDTYYNSFLQKHLDFVLANLLADMTAYLLVPYRGPGHYNLDSLFLVAKRCPKPGPFILRIKEWITDGYFDGRRSKIPDGELGRQLGPLILYECLNELAGLADDHPLQSLRIVVCDRVRMLLGSGDGLLGIYHLWNMHYAKFIDINHVFDRVNEFGGSDKDASELFHLLRYPSLDKSGKSLDLAEGLDLL
jgi:hypothetical protein